MKRKLTSILLMSALLVGGASTFVSCKDYDGDQAAVTNANVKGLSDKLQEQIAALEAAKLELAKKADKVYVDDAITRIDGTIAKLQSALTDVQNGVSKNATDIATLNDAVVAVKADITTINTKLDSKADKADLDNLNQKLTSVFGENFENALLKGHLAEYAASEEGAADFTAAMLTSLNSAIAAANTTQFDDVFSLFAYLDKVLPDTISALASKCAYLAGQDSLLNDRIDSLVTSVNVDMVSNPIYGTFNTPFGVKNYVLAGFVGGEIEKADFNGVKVGGLAASATGGNIYLTINPAEVNAEGWNLGKLVGRDGNTVPGYGDLILVADNTPVKTLATRASNGLGGYVAAPELVDPAAAKINVDKSELKEVAKNVLGKLRGQEALDVTNAVRTIYNTFANAIDQYYAVKCQVKDDQSYGDTKTKTYVSDYNIAAVTVKPLAYTTLAGTNLPNIPQIPSLYDKFGAIVTKIENPNVNISGVGEMTIKIVDGAYREATFIVDGSSTPYPRYYFNTVTIETIDGQDYAKINTYIINELSSEWTDNNNVSYEYINKMQVDRTTYIPVSAHEYDPATSTWTLTIGALGLDKLNKELSDVIGGVTGQVNDMIDKAADYAAKFDSKIGDRINKIIAGINSKLDNVNQYLQPIMLAAGNGEAVRLSEVKAFPTVFEGVGSVVLAPTSYTLELLAPAYKKSIKVNGTQLNDATLNGATKTVVATLEAGPNEIEYSTMDFYGNVVDKKYYIEVK